MNHSHIPRFSLFIGGGRKIEDPRLFMQCLYRYWYYKGYWGVVAASLVDFLNMFVVLLVAFLFTTRFRWDLALKCTEVECAASALLSGRSWPYIVHQTVWGYVFGFVFFTSSLFVCVYEGMTLLEMVCLQNDVEEVVHEAGIDTKRLSPFHNWYLYWSRRWATVPRYAAECPSGDGRSVLAIMSWGDFLERVCDAVNRNENLKFQAYGRPFDALSAVQALMQLDNYMIALHDSGLVERTSLRFMSRDTLLYLIGAMFDSFNTVDTRWERVGTLKENVRFYALLCCILFPFIASYSLLKVLVKNAAQVKANLHAYVQWDWNSSAWWTFRLYNEVNHLHACRMQEGRDVAALMVERLLVSMSLSRLIRRSSSTCVLVIVVLAFVNPSLLIGGHIAGLSLVWWLTIALVLYAMFTEDDPRRREYVYTPDLERLSQSIYYNEDTWCESGELFAVNIQGRFLQRRFGLICSDLFRSLCLPLILLYANYDGSVEALAVFVQQHSVRVEGVGSVALGSAFEHAEGVVGCFPRTNDLGEMSTEHATLYRGKPIGSDTGAAEEREGVKIKRSVASFCGVYRCWTQRHLGSGSEQGGVTLHCHDEVATGEDKSVCVSLQHYVRHLTSLVAIQQRSTDGERGAVSRIASMPDSVDRCDDLPVISKYFNDEVTCTLGDVSIFPRGAMDELTGHEQEHLFVSHVQATRRPRTRPSTRSLGRSSTSPMWLHARDPQYYGTDL